MAENWLKFTRQQNGDYLFSEDGLEIVYDNGGGLKCTKNEEVKYQHQYENATKAMLDAPNIYEKFK